MNRSRFTAVLTLLSLLSLSTSTLADVRADQKGLVKFEGMLGRMVSIFGGKAAKDGVKTTQAVKGDRKASLTDTNGQIIDLAEEKIYDLDIKKKTYKVTTFAELRRRMEEARKKAEEDARKEQEKGTAEARPDQSGKEIEVDFTVKETGQKKAINGFDTREVVLTVTLREKGKTIDQSGGLVMTADTWLGAKIAAMQELVDFDIRYAKQLAGPMVVGASPEEMAAAMAMYPLMKDAIGRMRTESVKLDGTAILSVVTLDAVKSAEQLAEEKKQAAQDSQPSASGGVGGLIGGFAKKAVKKEEPKQRTTFMTTTSEVLKVTTDVPATDVGIPAGFKETK